MVKFAKYAKHLNQKCQFRHLIQLEIKLPETDIF